MNDFVLLDGDGRRFAEFSAADRQQAWGIAVKLAAYPKPRPRQWSLIVLKDGGSRYMGGVGIAPKQAEADASPLDA